MSEPFSLLILGPVDARRRSSTSLSDRLELEDSSVLVPVRMLIPRKSNESRRRR